MYITKDTRWHPLCCCHGNSYAAGPVLIKAKIARFILNKDHPPNILMGRLKMIWEPCVFREKPSVPLTNVANGDICIFTERDWSQEYYHGNNIVGVNLFLWDVLSWCKVWRTLLQYFWRYSWFSILLFAYLHNTKACISLNQKKVFQKGKRHSSLLWKAFQIRGSHFFTSSAL